VVLCEQDDITYPSMAKAFNLPLELNKETVKRMQAGLKARGIDPNAQNADQRKARERMAELPTGEGAECIFVAEDKWVPVVRLGGRVSILSIVW
jgi:molybdopterin-biosynthesis enzyme MoeA-like protein